MKHINKLLIMVLLTSCNTDDFLDIKPKNVLIPTTLEDFRLLLDNQNNMNISPYSGQYSADDLDVVSSDFIIRSFERRMYTWDEELFLPTDELTDWSYSYDAIFTVNAVLEGLESSSEGSDNDRNIIKGEALFYRAFHHFNLVGIFATHYDSSTASSDLGVPLKLTTDVFAQVTRASVQEVYDAVINDLNAATQLLSNGSLKTRPSKVAAFGLLARVYLNMGEFTSALEAANSYLAIKSTLLDYNSLTPGDSSTSGGIISAGFEDNPELTFLSHSFPEEISGFLIPLVTSDFVNNFDSNDKKREIFFEPFSGSHYYFIGNYNTAARFFWSTPGPFSGISTDEVYLIKAECLARAGQISNAMDALNTLLENRYETGTFTPFVAASQEDAITTILEERRKQLLFRTTRWQDLKRLNKESGRETTLTRNFDGETHTLLPNDSKYVLPIPPKEIEKSGIEQNPRN